MRISDWSSDVCSSDLVVVQLNTKAWGVTDRICAIDRHRSVRHQIAPPRNVEFRKRFLTNDVGGSGIQVQRSSCRYGTKGAMKRDRQIVTVGDSRYLLGLKEDSNLDNVRLLHVGTA